jgi:2'-hydroxyisoflavone reductase
MEDVLNHSVNAWIKGRVMKVLVIGGTRFSGRFFSQYCLERGWSLTLFNRGTSNPELFADRARVIVGDRNSEDIEQLAGENFDAVVDMCGQLPSQVEALARLLEPTVTRYLFISSISAYSQEEPIASTHRLTEETALAAFTGEEDEEALMAHYSAFKAECERRVTAIFGEDRTLIVRPGLIVGPHDPTERFTWWIRRALRGGKILAPSAPEQPVQCVDARALATWMITALEEELDGAFHAVSPQRALDFDALIETICNLCAPENHELVRAPGELFLEEELAPWMQVPLWLADEPAGLLDLDPSKIYAAGFAPPSIEETILATMAWAKENPSTLPEDAPLGIPEDVEARLLESLEG